MLSYSLVILRLCGRLSGIKLNCVVGLFASNPTTGWLQSLAEPQNGPKGN